MKEELLASVKERIEQIAPPARLSSIQEYKWGKYDTMPDSSGVVYIEDGWYTFRNSDRGDSIFTGPIKDGELIGYLCAAVFAMNPQENKLEDDRLFEIMNSKFDGLETVQANVKKKPSEMNNGMSLS